MESQIYSLSVKDSIFDPYLDRSVSIHPQAYFYKKEKDKILYKVWIYLDGIDLPFIKRVKYILHETFIDPVKIVERTFQNPNCALAIMTWGIFDVKVEIEDKKGRIIRTTHYLTYNTEFSVPELKWELISL